MTITIANSLILIITASGINLRADDLERLYGAELARPSSSVCSDENRLLLWGEAEYHIYRMGVLDMKATAESRRLRASTGKLCRALRAAARAPETLPSVRAGHGIRLRAD